MSLPWSSSQRSAVQRILEDNPLVSNRCGDAAAGVVAVAEQAGWQAARVFFKNVEGFCILPVGHNLWPPWIMHVAAETRDHDVDVLTGPDGVSVEGYLKNCWRYPECMGRFSEQEWRLINQP